MKQTKYIGSAAVGALALALAALMACSPAAKPSQPCNAENLDKEVTVNGVVWDCESKTKTKKRKIAGRTVKTKTVSYYWEKD